MTDLIASDEDLRRFNSLPNKGKRLTSALRGVLAEAATTGIVRYNWLLLKPLVLYVLDSVLQDFDAESKVEIGPPLPLANDNSLADLQSRLHGYVNCFTEAPFTFQRLCELLVEPHKQYTYLHKVALAFERLLLVVKTQPVTGNLPPRPRIAELRPVNENIAVSHPVRPPDTHQRVPLEPLFHIDTEAQPAAEPMSIDTAPVMLSTESQAQTHAVDQGPARGVAPAQHSHAVKTEENGTSQPAHTSPIKTESQAQASKVLGQSKAGLLNKVHALEAANVPANGTEVMKVDGS
ncbi:hypothetical protein ABBQ38_003837 [Trebouxia sp. C0009 RCD-2024]